MIGMDALSASAWLFRYFMFIFWSVIYATFIVVLVVGSAPYASGSGKENDEFYIKITGCFCFVLRYS
jgi:hypothetical protein